MSDSLKKLCAYIAVSTVHSIQEKFFDELDREFGDDFSLQIRHMEIDLDIAEEANNKYKELYNRRWAEAKEKARKMGREADFERLLLEYRKILEATEQAWKAEIERLVERWWGD